MSSTLKLYFASALLITLVASQGSGQEKQSASKIRTVELGTTERVSCDWSNLFASQPSKEDLELAKSKGIKTVISLRLVSELDWDEAKSVEDLGLKWHNVAFKAADTLTDDVFKSAFALLKDKTQQPYLLHCSSANRVGAVWLAHRVLNDGLSTEAALKEGKEIGLSKPPHEKKALDFIQRTKTPSQASSVASTRTSSIQSWMSPDGSLVSRSKVARSISLGNECWTRCN